MNISSVKEILAAAERDAAAGRIDQSIARLKKALPRHRRSGRLPYQLGVFYFRQGQYPEAIESFQQALKCRLNTAEVQTSLGAALAASGRHEEAQKALRKALKLNPEDFKARANLAQIHTERGQADQALQVYDEAIGQNPTNTEAFFRRGNLHLLEGQFPEAISDYEQALALAPNDPRCLYNLGFACFCQGDHDQATEQYRAFLRINEEFAALYTYHNSAMLFEHGRQLAAENRRLRAGQETAFAGLIGQSPALQEVFDQIRQVAGTKVEVLILGETGTGKELIARAIHQQSARHDGPYYAINCATIPSGLVESELFGIEKGTATDVEAKEGAFEQADGGTLFMDEIGDMDLAVQAKVLRAIEEKKIRRVGGRKLIPLDIRLIAATSKDLRAMMKEGSFREDLNYRLNTIELVVPPLRERPEDIPLLAQHFLDHYRREHERPDREFSSETMAAFGRYDWPGNIRELRNAVQRGVLLSKNPLIELQDLSRDLIDATVDDPRREILQALETCKWNVTRAAQLLGIARETLQRKMKRLGIKNPRTNP